MSPPRTTRDPGSSGRVGERQGGGGQRHLTAEHRRRLDKVKEFLSRTAAPDRPLTVIDQDATPRGTSQWVGDPIEFSPVEQEERPEARASRHGSGFCDDWCGRVGAAATSRPWRAGRRPQRPARSPGRERGRMPTALETGGRVVPSRQRALRVKAATRAAATAASSGESRGDAAGSDRGAVVARARHRGPCGPSGLIWLNDAVGVDGFKVVELPRSRREDLRVGPTPSVSATASPDDERSRRQDRWPHLPRTKQERPAIVTTAAYGRERRPTSSRPARSRSAAAVWKHRGGAPAGGRSHGRAVPADQRRRDECRAEHRAEVGDRPVGDALGQVAIGEGGGEGHAVATAQVRGFEFDAAGQQVSEAQVGPETMGVAAMVGQTCWRRGVRGARRPRLTERRHQGRIEPGQLVDVGRADGDVERQRAEVGGGDLRWLVGRTVGIVGGVTRGGCRCRAVADRHALLVGRPLLGWR